MCDYNALVGITFPYPGAAIVPRPLKDVSVQIELESFPALNVAQEIND
jgi:hypothetical protein